MTFSFDFTSSLGTQRAQTSHHKMDIIILPNYASDDDRLDNCDNGQGGRCTMFPLVVWRLNGEHTSSRINAFFWEPEVSYCALLDSKS